MRIDNKTMRNIKNKLYFFIMEILEKVNFYINGGKMSKKTITKCFCPECKNDLVANNSHIGPKDKSVESYKCVVCGMLSDWYFESPVPFLIKTL